jgi:signal peptidase II
VSSGVEDAGAALSRGRRDELPSRGRHWTRWLWISLAVVVLDYATKQAILASFRPGEERALLPFLSLVLAFNPGAAFSFLAGAGGWQRWLFAAIAVIASLVVVWLLRSGGNRLYCLGLALIMGGALGNLWDRLTIGQVVDFVLFHWRGWSFPAFNVADSAITIGAGLLILDSFAARPGKAP